MHVIFFLCYLTILEGYLVNNDTATNTLSELIVNININRDKQLALTEPAKID